MMCQINGKEVRIFKVFATLSICTFLFGIIGKVGAILGAWTLTLIVVPLGIITLIGAVVGLIALVWTIDFGDG